MPNIETNLKKNNFAKPTLNVLREDIFYRKDVRDSFGYVAVGITVSLALTGIIYTVGKKLIA